MKDVKLNEAAMAAGGDAGVCEKERVTVADGAETSPETSKLELVFLIDRSGSMGSSETRSTVVEEFNKLLTEQQAMEGDVVVSTVLFNRSLEWIHDAVPVKECEKMTHRMYHPYGGTALLDAVGTSVQRVLGRQLEVAEEARSVQTLLVIMTDGEENASWMFSLDEVKALLKRVQQKHHWQVLYLGANVDHFAEAEKLGIQHEDAQSFCTDHDGIAQAMLITKRSAFRLRKLQGFVQDDWRSRARSNRGKPLPDLETLKKKYKKDYATINDNALFAEQDIINDNALSAEQDTINDNAPFAEQDIFKDYELSTEDITMEEIEKLLKTFPEHD